MSVLLLFLIGCYSTYNIFDFSSKKEFYDDFNKCANDKQVQITLKNDSTFTAENGAVILNDTLTYFWFAPKNEKITPDEISFIKYTGSDMRHLSAEILLKNGNTVVAKNVSLISDSCFSGNVYEKISRHIPVSEISNAGYKNHWLGIPFGILPGAILGFIAGAAAYSVNPATNTWGGNYVFLFGGAPLGLITGGIWGWLTGWTYTYEFFP
jgi:hypothetical protein